MSLVLGLNGCGNVGWNEEPGTLAESEADNVVFVNDGSGAVRAFAAQDFVPIKDLAPNSNAFGESHQRRFLIATGATQVNSQYHPGTDELYMVGLDGNTQKPQWLIAAMAHASRRTGINNPQRTFALPAQEEASNICLDPTTDTLYVATTSQKLLVYAGVSQKSGQPSPDRTVNFSGEVRDMAYDTQRDRLYFIHKSGGGLGLVDRLTGYTTPVPVAWPSKANDSRYASMEFAALAVDAVQDRLYLLVNASNPSVSTHVDQSLWAVDKASLGGAPAKIMDLADAFFSANGSALGLRLDPEGQYLYISGPQNVYRLSSVNLLNDANPKLDLVLKEKDAQLSNLSFSPKTPHNSVPSLLQGAQAHAMQVVNSSSALVPKLVVVDKPSQNLVLLPSAVPDLTAATLSARLLKLPSSYGGELGYDYSRDILYFSGGVTGGVFGSFLTAVPGINHLTEKSGGGLEGAVPMVYGAASQQPIDLAVDAVHDAVYVGANSLSSNTWSSSTPDYSGVLYKLKQASTVKANPTAQDIQSYALADGLSMMALDADRQKVYALNSHPWQARQLFVLDLATGARTALEVPVGQAGDILSLAVDTAHDRLYIGTAHAGIAAIDRVSTSARQGVSQVLALSGVQRLSIDTTNDRLFVGSGPLIGWFDHVSTLTGTATANAPLSLVYSSAVRFGNVVIKP